MGIGLSELSATEILLTSVAEKALRSAIWVFSWSSSERPMYTSASRPRNTSSLDWMNLVMLAKTKTPFQELWRGCFLTSRTAQRSVPLNQPYGTTLGAQHLEDLGETLSGELSSSELKRGNVSAVFYSVEFHVEWFEPLVIGWYSLLQSSGQWGDSFSRVCPTLFFFRFSGKLLESKYFTSLGKFLTCLGC